MARPTTKREDQPMANNGPGREDIERRAYELYLARGRADGYALEDWLQAEQELQSRPAQN